jgi:hypothetical protein
MQCIYVGLARTIYIRCIYSIFGRKITNIRSYTVYIYGSGQPYAYVNFRHSNEACASNMYGSGRAYSQSSRERGRQTKTHKRSPKKGISCLRRRCSCV